MIFQMFELSKIDQIYSTNQVSITNYMVKLSYE